ncbi:hypothetical protein ACKVEX_14915 [Rhodocyclaceae bacterium SMB388]
MDSLAEGGHGKKSWVIDKERRAVVDSGQIRSEGTNHWAQGGAASSPAHCMEHLAHDPSPEGEQHSL